jgi:hypothetical protein
VEHIGGLPEFLKQVHQIQDQSDVEFLVARVWRARSPSVKAKRVMHRDGPGQSISSATS